MVRVRSTYKSLSSQNNFLQQIIFTAYISWSLVVSAWQTQPEGNLKALMDGHKEELVVLEGRESSFWNQIDYEYDNSQGT